MSVSDFDNSKIVANFVSDALNIHSNIYNYLHCSSCAIFHLIMLGVSINLASSIVFGHTKLYHSMGKLNVNKNSKISRMEFGIRLI